MDNVLADVEGHAIAWYKKEYGVSYSKEQLNGQPEGSGFENQEAFWRYVHSPGFFRTVPVMDGALDVLQKLNTIFDIYVVSAAMEFPQSLEEKYEWLDEHCPFITWKQRIFCGDKSVIHTDYMLDDHTKNLDHHQGTSLLFTACHNTLIKHHKRLNNWKEVGVYFNI